MIEIPPRWRSLTLNELQADVPRAITDGPFGSNLTSAHYTDSGPRVVRLQNIGDGRFIDARAHISPEHFIRLRTHEVLPGDLLIASLGESPPRACIAPAWLGPAIVKADCIRVRLSPAVDPRWVLYALQAPFTRHWAAEKTYGVGRPRLGLKTIRAIPIPLPALPEQRRIVEILEDHLSRLDAALSGLGQCAAKLELMRLSLLNRERRALVSEGVPLRRIGDVCETALGKMLDAKRARGTPTPYLRNFNVRWGFVDLGDVLTVPLTAHEQDRFSLRAGDILVCEGGEPGRCAVWQGEMEPMSFQKALHRVRPKNALDPRYVAMMIEEFIRSGRGSRLFTGTTIKHLPQEKLRDVLIPVPDLDRQSIVLTALAELDQVVTQASISLKIAQRRTGALRRGLLTAAFTGRLIGRSSDEAVEQELAGV